jgi:hypothetical protein
VRAAAAVLAVSVLALAWVFGGGPAGWLYCAIYLLALAPGLPLGIALFGRHHAAAWIAGGLIGYGLTQLAIWAVIAAEIASAPAFAAAWLILCVVSWTVARAVPAGPAVALPAWTARDTRALLLVLLLVPVLMGPPYRNLGRADAAGNRYYRAYFTADFVWHSALAYELGKFSLPPRNPYLAPRAMNYYWTYFLLPSTVAASTGVLRDVQACLKTNAFLTALLMVAALFLLVHTSVASPSAAALAVCLAVVAASAEGAYAIGSLISRDRPLTALLDINVDAVTAWPPFGGLRIDNIPRSLWYTPQHTMSIALGLVALVIASAAGAAARLPAIAAAGLALGLATTMNPLLGGVCSMVYGITVTADMLRTRADLRQLPKHALAAIPVVLAVAWASTSKVMEGGGSALEFGFTGFSRNYPVVTLLLSLGPLVLPALGGLWPARSHNARATTIGATGLVLGLLLLYLVRISEASWVGFRAGQIILISLPVLLAPMLARLRTAARMLLVVVILVAGLPTTIVDTWNAQDIGNRRPGPGFRWTLWITPDQQQAFAWIQANTAADAIVQMEPIVRAREHWTLIPSFAGRRMAAGQPISLLPVPDYRERSERVRTIFASAAAEEAWSIARRLRIDYLYVDDTDTAAYPEGVRKFDRYPVMFERVFANATVRLYRVR